MNSEGKAEDVILITDLEDELSNGQSENGKNFATKRFFF